MAKMTGKELMQELCDELQKHLDRYAAQTKSKPETVDFISLKLKKEWIVEIRINNKPIFRDSEPLSTRLSLETTEELLINRLLHSVFTYGVMASKEQLEKLK